MDISVSHLNHRLALQTPTQLPLGLVFVQGHVANLTLEEEPKTVRGTSFPVALDLLEGNCSIRCRLSARVASEISVQDGDRIRAGGHLIFDTSRAHYELLARDVEVVVEDKPISPDSEYRLGRLAMIPVLADIKKRSEATRLAQEGLPVWVQRMAPPEIRAEIGVSFEENDKFAGEHAPALDEDLVQFLSAAIEKSEDVEITADLLDAVLTPTAVVPQEIANGHDNAGIPVVPGGQFRQKHVQQPVDWSLILLVVSVMLLAAALLLIFLTQAG